MKPVEPMSPEPMILGVTESDRMRVGFVRRRMGLEIADCMFGKWVYVNQIWKGMSTLSRHTVEDDMCLESGSKFKYWILK